MRMKSRKQTGFTLIEVIVVAVIIAVLSAVAIPLYNGYLKDSRVRTAENVAGSAASFLGTAVAQQGIQTTTTVKYRKGGDNWTALNDDIDDWTTLNSESGSPAEIGVFEKDTDADPLNSFIIPTGIAIKILQNAGTVQAKHASSADGDATQLYHFKTAVAAANPNPNP